MNRCTTIRRRQRAYTLAVLVLVLTSSHIDRQIVAILGQPLKEALSISDTQLGLMSGVVFALFYATLGMPMAMWADRHNRRNLIAFSIALWSGMTALCGLAQNYVQLLLARIGVGVGEAGSNPPSHSIISDLYGPAERATALAIFATGVNFGVMLGYLIGGWVNEWLDWRWAFIIAGLPGLAIALIVRFTIAEPTRGHSESQTAASTKAPPFWTVVQTMMCSAVLRNTVIAGALVSFTGYALVLWVPVFLVRVHGMGTGEAGTILAFLIGLGGALGTFAGGWFADRLSRRGNPGWRAWIIVAINLFTGPLLVAAFTRGDAPTTLLFFALPAVFMGAFIGPTFAIIQSNCPVHMRSVAAAINLFVLNIVGLGLGPFTVGAISDLFADSQGLDSLRYGLLATIPISVWGWGHYLRVGMLLARGKRPST
jgi:MFS family permease